MCALRSSTLHVKQLTQKPAHGVVCGVSTRAYGSQSKRKVQSTSPSTTTPRESCDENDGDDDTDDGVDGRAGGAQHSIAEHVSDTHTVGGVNAASFGCPFGHEKSAHVWFGTQQRSVFGTHVTPSHTTTSTLAASEDHPSPPQSLAWQRALQHSAVLCAHSSAAQTLVAEFCV
jgi:hypothetical protein